MNQKRKVPKFAAAPSISKKPIISRWPTDNESRERIAWRVGDAELVDPWPWTAISPEDAVRVHRLLSDLEKMTWGEACQGGTKVKLERLADAPPRVRHVLEDCQRDDVDHLVNIRLTGVERIWGVRRGNACHLLWWDPRHEVWPAPKN